MQKTDSEHHMTINADFLAHAARQASRLSDLQVLETSVEDLKGGFESGVRLQRVRGTGQSAGTMLPWQMVVKTFFAQPNNANPQGSHYWKREASYYGSGQLQNLPAGLRAPQCFAICETPEFVQVFLEDLQDETGQFTPGWNWQAADYREVARALGRFHGAYLTGAAAMPTGEWVPANWLQAYVEEAAGNIERYFQCQDIPMVKRAFRPVTPAFIRQTWEKRAELLSEIAKMPQVFCHQDAFCRNLFSQSLPATEDLVGVDWSYSGPAALGSELVPLVQCAVPILGPLPITQIQPIANFALEGYLAGLREVGSQPDEDAILYTFRSVALLRYTLGGMIGDHFSLVADEANYPFVEQAFGVPIEVVADLLAEDIAWQVEGFDMAQASRR